MSNIHSTAIIDKNCIIGNNVTIGAYTVIEGNVKIDDDNKKVDVYMNADQVSLAIGKGGYNIGLASRLTGYEIDVYRDEEGYEDDVDIKEFSDEIEEWIIDALKSIGCDTAKSVLSIEAEELVKRTDLEIETIKEVIEILKKEFE